MYIYISAERERDIYMFREMFSSVPDSNMEPSIKRPFGLSRGVHDPRWAAVDGCRGHQPEAPGIGGGRYVCIIYIYIYICMYVCLYI